MAYKGFDPPDSSPDMNLTISQPRGHLPYTVFVPTGLQGLQVDFEHVVLDSNTCYLYSIILSLSAGAVGLSNRPKPANLSA